MLSMSVGLPSHLSHQRKRTRGTSEAIRESVTLVQLRGARFDRDWLLRFRDRRLEARYCADHYTPLNLFFAKTLLLWGCVGIVEFIVFAVYARLAETEAVALVTGWCRVGQVLTNILLGLAVALRLLHCEAGIMAVLVLQPALIVSSNAFRLSKILASDYWQRQYGNCGAETCEDDSFLILILLIPCVAPMAMSVRVARSCFVAPWVVIVYTASSMTFGPLPAYESGLRAVIFAVMAFFLIWGAYRVERDLRWKWGANMQLRVDNAAQLLELEQHRLWVQDLEERCEALGGGPLKAASLLAAAGDDAGDNLETTLEVPSPHEKRCMKSTSTLGLSSQDATASPNGLLSAALAGRQADAERLRRMALRLPEPGYGVDDFFEDVVETFPELQLFFVSMDMATSSGNSPFVEYQRTIGALFAVYWLARLESDGKEGFCFGYGEDWQLAREPSANGQGAKRQQFFESMDWSYLADVVRLSMEDSVERLEAMLSLSAIHDLMKVPGLCPTVGAEHAPYQGYSAGDTITDHDMALAYILEYYPDLLPSFRILPQASRDLILFTQGGMNFNHGWFVQAEAPPRAMLAGLRAALAKARPADVSFYFLHWLTDLSGAEGRPLGGAEKFVLRFPRAVLSAFTWSIPYLQHLTYLSETEVVEGYLEARFRMALPDLPEPMGPEAVALLRLVVMAEGGGHLVASVFPKLHWRSRQILSEELARTGLRDQCFTRSPQSGGPALFVYYGPALLQRCATEPEMAAALSMLATVYHAGRRLWPVSSAAADTVVTLHGGALKAHGEAIARGETVVQRQFFALERRSDVEGVVSLVTPGGVNGLVKASARFWALDPEDLLKEGNLLRTVDLLYV